MRQKIKELLEAVKKSEAESGRAAKESKFAADEVSGGLVASYSAAGDAEHARNSANLSIEKAKGVKNLMEEIKKAISLETPKTVVPVCCVSVKFIDGSSKDLFLVRHPMSISGFNLISVDSPIGKSLLNKNIGSRFSYVLEDQRFDGEIIGLD